MLRCVHVSGLVAVALMLPAAVRAQDQPIMIVVSKGAAPVADVRVYAVPNMYTVPEDLGLTSPDGTLVFDHKQYVQSLRDFRREERHNWGVAECKANPNTPTIYFEGRANASNRWTFVPPLGQDCTWRPMPPAVATDPRTIAFDIFGDRPTVIRGGYGIYYDGMLGAKAPKYGNFGDGLDKISSELRALNYNTVNGETDDKTWGAVGGVGVTFGFNRHLGLRLGVQYEDLGKVRSNVTGSRINVTGTPSNVSFTSTTDVSGKLINLEWGVPISFGRLRLTPNLASGWGKITGTSTSTLLAGQPGPTPPTTQVNASSVETKSTKFGLGWNIRGSFALARHVEVFGQYQSRTFKGVFTQPNEGRLPSDLTNTGIVVGFGFNSTTPYDFDPSDGIGKSRSPRRSP